ncbi:glycosyltransferase family 2 protein [Sinomonas sp. R1AF57]|uniref:glycosyltransferase family 2 protein n=1 Tax=Sinomonas sp. R1AF57 TaxID=2020377 RepID=UPI000B60A8A2|nr:glycosyltransferase family 2 protein [Sinomonas sp. R1AF57]ASN51446.1 glycosyl transferase [Sinomonas sp. R1AF57]
MHVTAVVVAHDGGAYLPLTLAAISSQTRPVDVVLGADTGSGDDSAEVLGRALGADHVVAVRGSGGFGGAARSALDKLAPPRRGPDGPAQQWVWLLHDDSAPAPDALAELLGAVERAPSVAVAGCKQLDADAPRRLLDVGLSVSRWGERLTLIDVDEQDQGQHDARSDVFAVNSAGMLVRRDAWEQLGGFDPGLPATGDDVDFCWRARLAGHRVVVVPSARILHSQRPEAAGTPFAARRAEVYSRLKHSPGWQLPFQALGALLGGLWQFLLGIVLKEPGVGAARLGASLAALGAVGHLARGRRAARRTRTVSRSTPRELQTSRAEIWAHRRALLESAAADSEAVVGDGSGSAAGPEEPTGDSQHDFAALAVATRGWPGTGAVVVAGAALLASLVALAPLLGAQAAVGGALIPVSSALGDIYANATAWWSRLGAGEPGYGDPFDLVLWLLGLVGFGDANRALALALVAASPLAALGAWALAANLTAHRAPRVLAAVVWAAAPALLIAVGEGRIGSVVAHAALPWAALGLLRAVGGARVRAMTASQQHEPRPGSGGVPSWTAAAAGGLALGLATAGAPSLVPFAVIVVVAGVVALRGQARALWWALVPTVAVFLPVWVSTAERPRAWIADPGLPTPFVAASPWQMLLGQPLAFDPAAPLSGLAFLPAGVPWSLVGALVLAAPILLGAAAAAVLLRGRRGTAARALVAIGILALAYAWAVSRIPVAVSGDTLVAPFAGPSLGAATLGFLGAAVLGADRLIEHRRAAANRVADGDAHQERALRRRARTAAAVTAVALIGAGAGPAAALAHWAWAGLSPARTEAHGLGPDIQVAPGAARTLPATAADLGLGPQQTRTLVLGSADDGSVTASLMRGAGTTLDALSAAASASRITGPSGAERIADDDGALVALRRAVATVGGAASGGAAGVDPSKDLTALGVGFIVLQDRSAADEVAAARIDSVPSLVPVGRTDAGWLWRVTPNGPQAGDAFAIAQRARIVDSKGKTLSWLPSGPEQVSADVPAGGGARRLVLAERSGPGWTATLNGVALTPTAQDWAQAFELPEEGGRLEVRYAVPAAAPLGLLAAVAIGLTVLLAVPARIRRRTSRGRTGAGLLLPETAARRHRLDAPRPEARSLDAPRPEAQGDGGTADGAADERGPEKRQEDPPGGSGRRGTERRRGGENAGPPDETDTGNADQGEDARPEGRERASDEASV